MEGIVNLLMALKVIEGLFTVLAPVERLTGRAAELADQAGMVRMTSGAGDRFFLLEQSRVTDLLYGSRRRNAIGP